LHACAAEAKAVIANEAYSPASHPANKQQIPCYDPGNMQFLGMMAADSAEQARRACRRRPKRVRKRQR